MTVQDAGDKLKEAVQGLIGRMLMSATLAVLLGLSAWALKTMNDHSVALASLSADVQNLIRTVQGHDSAVDAELRGVVGVDDELRADVARLQEAEAQRERGESRLAPRRIEGGP
jgi:hypothetical protein